MDKFKSFLENITKLNINLEYTELCDTFVAQI